MVEATEGAAGAQQPLPLRISRAFPAPRALLFRAWSSADHIKRWFSPETYSVPDARVQMHVGGHFDVCMRGPYGGERWIRGTFVEVIPYNRLVIEMRVVDAERKPLFNARTEVTFAVALLAFAEVPARHTPAATTAPASMRALLRRPEEQPAILIYEILELRMLLLDDRCRHRRSVRGGSFLLSLFGFVVSLAHLLHIVLRFLVGRNLIIFPDRAGPRIVGGQRQPVIFI